MALAENPVEGVMERDEPQDQASTNGNGPAEGAAAQEQDGVRAFDQNGREVIVPREQWRGEVLPTMIQEAWETPEQLYAVVLNSLQSGFGPELLEAARHLRETDPIPARGACMLGIVLAQTGQKDEARQLFERFTAEQGEDGSVLVNLARLYADAGDPQRADATLRRALELEPNHDNGLGWYLSQIQQQGGDQAARAALEQLAAHPSSWRAQLFLARGELAQGNLGRAKELYTQALERAPKPVPPDLLMQLSGDLGSHGHLIELIEFTVPQFVPELHGLPVGNNLIKALIDTGNLEPAEQVKAALWRINRPDWKDMLTFWDAELSRQRAARVARGEPAQPQQQQIQVAMLRVDGPVWLPPGSPARRLFGAKSPAAPTVTFLGGSAEAPEDASPENRQRLGDALSRMTRALPLFLAEQTDMRTAAQGRAMLPWAAGGASGFLVSGQRWPEATALEATRTPENRSDYVVTVHLDAEVEPWTADLTFIRTADGTPIGELSAEFQPESFEQPLGHLADEVVELLSVLGPANDPPAYLVPGPERFGSYLLGLEQMLAIRCAGMDGVPPQFLSGENEILAGELELCRFEPENIPARLLLLGSYSTLAKLRPDTTLAFADQLAALKQNNPLPDVDTLPL